jgi:hypothetical protein
MDYNNKYLKYKLKYNLLKKLIGGFKLTDYQEGFLYPKMIKYYTKFQDYFNAILLYINILELKDFFEPDKQKLIKKILQYKKIKDLDFNNITDIKYFLNLLIEEIKNNFKLKDYNELFEMLEELCKLNDIINIKKLYKQVFDKLKIIIEKLLNIILKSDLRKEILKNFFNIFIENKEEHINIQYASFVFLSFFLEFELFLITYSKIPYNYFIKDPFNFQYKLWDLTYIIVFNNNKKKIWETNTTINIFNEKFSDNILDILEKYATYLEEVYENFINALYQQYKDIPDFDTIFYNNDYERAYDHLNHDWYNKIIQIDPKFNQQLSTFFTNYIIKNHKYNTSQVGLFDFVFSLNHTRSCITMTTLKVYFATRLHLPNFHVILQNKKENTNVQQHSTITELLPCNYLSHWVCDDKQCFQSMQHMDTTQKLDIYDEKVEVFIALLFDIYNKYNELNENEIITQQKEYILNLIFKLLLDNNRLELFNKHYYWINFIDKSTLEKMKEKVKALPNKYLNLEQILDESKRPIFFEMLQKVKNDGLVLKHASEELRNNKTIVLTAIEQNGLALEFASEELRKDKEVVLKAIENNGLALEFASKELRKDYDIVLKAVKNDGLALKNADSTLQNNYNIVLSAIKQNAQALIYSGKIMQGNTLIIAEAIQHDISLLQYAYSSIKADKTFILNTVEKNGLALEFASEKLRNDKDVVLKAISNNPDSFNFASDTLKKNIDILLLYYNHPLII